MSNPISILINGQLNVSQTTQQLRSQIAQLQRQVGSVQINANVNTNQMNNATRQINNLSNAARDANKATQGFFDAFGKVAIWGVVTGSVYGTIRAFKDMVAEIVTVDTKLTELRRVTNQGFPINKTLQDAIQLSSQLGNNLNDVLETINGFAAAGNFTEQQLIQLTKVATVASNVSDLKPQDAMSDLISVMRAYGVQAQNTMSIVDKMNEVDNNYSITTVQIAESLKKASSTAKTFGVDIDHLIADTTAIGQVTQESGDVIGNSLKSIYSRLTTVKASVQTLQSIGIATKDNNGEMRSASAILDDLANKWGTLNKAQQEQAAVNIAGRYQLSRFIALMTQHKQETDALTTSINSQGSAMRENAKYLDSMQAKINSMKNAFAELSLAMGKAFVSDTLVEVVKGFTGLAEAGVHIVQVFGGLPSLVTAGYVAFLAFGGEARKFVTSMAGVNAISGKFGSIMGSLRATLALVKMEIEEDTVGMTGLSRVMAVAGATARTFGILFKEALISTGIGIAIVGASILVEKLIQSYSDAQAKQRQLQEQQDQLTASFNNNKDTIKQLANQYEILGQQSDSLVKGTQDNKDYLSVQTRLAHLLPAVVDNIDATGQAHLKSADAVKQEITQLDKLNNLKSDKFVEDFSKSLDSINKKIATTQNTIAKIGSTQLVSTGVMANQFGTQTHPLTTDDKINKITQEMQLQQQIQQRVNLFKQLSTEYAKSIGVENELTASDKEYFSQLVDGNKKQLSTANGAKQFQDQLQKTISIVADLRGAVGKGIDVSKIFPDLSKNTAEQEKQLAIIDDSIKKYSTGAMSAKQFAAALATVGISGSKAKDILKALTTVQNDNLGSTKAQIDAQKVLQGVMDGTSKIDDVLSQEIIGYTSKEIDQQTQLIQLYSALSKVTNKNAEQMALYNQVKQQLISLFPEEYKGQKLSLTGMMDEVNARKVMSQAAVDSASNRMSAEEQVTYNLAQNLQKQEQIIKAMIKNYEALMMSAVTVDPKNGAVAMSGVAMHWYNQMKDAEKQLSTVSASYISTTAKLAKEMNYKVDFTTPDFPGTSGSSGSSKKGKSSSGSSSSSANNAKQQAQDLANSIVQIYKDMYQKEEDIAVASIQKQMDALDAQHQKVMDNLQKEDQAYQDSVNKKLALIDKQSAAQSYSETLKQQQQAVQNDQNKINVLKLDNSPEGKAALAAAQQQLASDQKTLNDTTSQHTTDLRKQNLQDSLSAYQADIQAQQDAETKKYNDQKAALQKQQDQVKAYYDNLINDQRKFNQITNDVLKGNFSSIKKDFSSFADFIKKNMSDIGKSISENLLDNMTNAEKQMGSVNSKSSSSKSSGSSSKKSSSSPSSKKNRYYTVKSGDTLGEIADKYYGHSSKSYVDKIANANHISDSSKIKIGERLLIPYNTGGYTGSWGTDGRLALLHQKELVLNQYDTSNMLKMVNIVRDMMPKLDIAKLGSKIGNTIHMPISIQNLNGGKEGAMELFNIIGNELKLMGVNN